MRCPLFNDAFNQGARQLVSRVLTDCSLIKNNLDIESATMLAKIGTEKGIMLSGIKRDQTEANLSSRGLQSADGILIASDLRVSPVLTNLNLYNNSIGSEGAKALAAALSSGSAVLTRLNVEYNPRMGDDAKQALRAATAGRKNFVLEM